MRMIDLTGKKFAKLTVIEKSIERGNRGQIKWNCLCECGKVKVMEGGSLRAIQSKLCCEKERSNFTSPAARHGMSKSRMYRIYRHMINRCSNKNVDSYYLYGGRGISVCKEWAAFEAFRDWSLKNGYAENLSIDRKDNDKGYYPENCRWVTTTDQARNKRNNVVTIEIAREIKAMREAGVKNHVIARKFGISTTVASEIFHCRSWREDDLAHGKVDNKFYLTYKGETKSASDWQRDPRVCVNYATIIRRKRAGMSDEDAIFSPKITHNGRHNKSYIAKHSL
jgi:hypothetical protein